MCHKADPESKGPIENSVGFVKKNFFSARNITSIDDVWKSLPGWLERKNKRLHQATFCVPLEIYCDIEKEALRPLVPSFYEHSPSSYTQVEISGHPFIQYKSSKYSVPRDCCFHTVYYKVIGEKLHIYDEDHKYLCSHSLSACRGRVIQLDEHKRQPSTAWMPIAERMRAKWNCVDFQLFNNGVKKENPRYVAQQLSAIEQFLDQQNPDRALVASAMKIACEKYRYRFSQFRVVFHLLKTGQMTEGSVESSDVQKQDLSVYQQAFDERCVQ